METQWSRAAIHPGRLTGLVAAFKDWDLHPCSTLKSTIIGSGVQSIPVDLQHEELNTDPLQLLFI